MADDEEALCIHVATVAVVAELRLMGLMGTLLSTPWMARQEAQTGNTSRKSVGKAVHLL